MKNNTYTDIDNYGNINKKNVGEYITNDKKWLILWSDDVTNKGIKANIIYLVQILYFTSKMFIVPISKILEKLIHINIISLEKFIIIRVKNKYLDDNVNIGFIKITIAFISILKNELNNIKCC